MGIKELEKRFEKKYRVDNTKHFICYIGDDKITVISIDDNITTEMTSEQFRKFRETAKDGDNFLTIVEYNRK